MFITGDMIIIMVIISGFLSGKKVLFGIVLGQIGTIAKYGLFKTLLGVNILTSSEGRKWNYANRPWVGIGIGYKIGFIK